MHGVHPAGDPVEPPRPRGAPLRACPVRHPGEAVVVPDVLQAHAIHLPCEPLPPVEPYLDGEGEPRLDAGVEAAELRMHPVLVQEPALALPRDPLEAMGLPIPVDVERPAGLQAAQQAHQSLVDPVARRDRAGQRVLVLLRRQILHRASRRFSVGVHRLLQATADLLHVPAKVHQPYVVRRQVGHHALRVAESPQVSAEHDSVASAQHAGDLVAVFRGKLVHGASVPPRCGGVVANPTFLLGNGGAFFLYFAVRQLCSACRPYWLLSPPRRGSQAAHSAPQALRLTAVERGRSLAQTGRQMSWLPGGPGGSFGCGLRPRYEMRHRHSKGRRFAITGGTHRYASR